MGHFQPLERFSILLLVPRPLTPKGNPILTSATRDLFSGGTYLEYKLLELKNVSWQPKIANRLNMAPNDVFLLLIQVYHLKIGGFQIPIIRSSNTGLKDLGGSTGLLSGRDCPP